MPSNDQTLVIRVRALRTQFGSQVIHDGCCLRMTAGCAFDMDSPDWRRSLGVGA